MSDWMTIRVELTSRQGEPLVSPPGRILLAHPDHLFADLAEAIDNAFGRWDVTPLHEFAVDGRRVLPGGDPDDDEAEDSESLTLGEMDLETGDQFSYVFDLGEGWEHDCRVEETGVDPADGIEGTDVPVPVFGWGSIPDQYGRTTDDDPDLDGEFEADEPDRNEEPGDDDIDFGIVESAVPGWRVAAPAADLEAAAARLRTESEVGLPPYDVLLAAAGFPAGDLPADDELWVGVAAGVIQPVTAAAGDPGAEAVWATMEAADWAGLIIGLVRGDIGQSTEPEVLAHLIASCPDVETEPLLGDDLEAVLEALDTIVAWWQALGAVDDDRRLTALGRWGLPLSLAAAWE